MDNYLNIIPYNTCTGCGACSAICPRTCIKMTEDELGFEIPVINSTLCIHCEFCKKVCPVYNDYGAKINRVPLRVIAAKNKEMSVVTKSSSGGIFSAFAENIINRKGIVYGVALTNTLKAEHVRIEDIESIIKVRGSKYIHSTSSNAFSTIKSDLKSNRLVLFSGTPCQIAALRQYLRLDYPNLLCIEVVCHGVPTHLAFQKYIKYLENKHKSEIIDVNFRDKAKGWENNRISFKFANGKILSQRSSQNLFAQGYINNLFVRDSCTDCRFKALKSNADVTLGDMWGVENMLPNYNATGGVSLICVNSLNGENALGQISDMITGITEVPYKDVCKYNECIVKCVKPHKNRTYVLNHLSIAPYNILVKSALENNLQNRLISRYLSIKAQLIRILVFIKHRIM